MEQGWIKVHRSIIDKGWFSDSQAVHLWMYLLLKATHGTREVLWNGQVVKIQAGQLLTGRKKISNDTGINESKVERLLKLFENEQQIEQRKTNTSRLISILNYKKFQSSEQPIEQRMNNKRTTDEQRMNTIQELKNKRNKELKNEFNTPANAGGLDDLNKLDKNEADAEVIPTYQEGGESSTEPKKRAVTKKKKDITNPHFNNCMEIYAEWYQQWGRPLRITPADGKGLNEIIQYLAELPTIKDGNKNIEDAFKFILVNWGKLDKWQQGQTELRQINSRITNIIQQLKSSHEPRPITHTHEQDLLNFVESLRNQMG